MTVADIDGIHAVREQARMAIGVALGDALRGTYERLTDRGPYQIDGVSIGRRALRNTCLAYLATQSDRARLAKAQFDAGRNMTSAGSACGAVQP